LADFFDGRVTPQGVSSEADRADVAAHIAEFGNDSVNRRYAWERQTSDLDTITRLPALDLVLGLAAGKRSDIYSWDLLGSQKVRIGECAGITPPAAVAQGHRGVRPEGRKGPSDSALPVWWFPAMDAAGVGPAEVAAKPVQEMQQRKNRAKELGESDT
jgi:hypothetical protein